MLVFFFFNDTATTEIYTLSLHDALPISPRRHVPAARRPPGHPRVGRPDRRLPEPPAADRHALDRKSTRLNSSHANISYAVFCLKKKKKHQHSPSLLTTLNFIIHTISQHL